MDMLKIISFGLIATLCISIIKCNQGYSAAYSDVLRILVTTIFMIFIVTKLSIIYEILRQLADKINMQDTYLNIVLKVVGIAYLTEFGTHLCEDAGEKAIAKKIELSGKVMIFVVASPVILALINMITDLI